MEKLFDVLEANGTMLDTRAWCGSTMTGRRFSSVARPLAPVGPRGGRERWSSSLCEHDLQCLLDVIEVDLLPQLLNSYSPARYSRLAPAESPG